MTDIVQHHQVSQKGRMAIFIGLAVSFVGAIGFGIYSGRELFLSSAPWWMWGALFGTLFTAVAVDLGSHGVNKKTHEISTKNAIAWSAIWVIVALGFGLFISAMGPRPWTETFSLYTTGWALENTLALDNLFVMMLIFGSFGLMKPERMSMQMKVLYYGIVGMVLMRVLFLAFGAFFINLPRVDAFGLHISYVQLIFAGIIAWSVFKMGGDDDEAEVDYTDHWSVRGTRWAFPVNPSVESGNFMTRKGVTPLFLCAVCVEFCDFMFAFDSMPVIISVVKDPFLMAASNLMACAGLRSLYFVLLSVKNKLWALDSAVKYLLIYIAVKLVIDAVGLDHMVPLLGQITSPVASLIIVIGAILTGIAVSLLVKNPEGDKEDIVA